MVKVELGGRGALVLAAARGIGRAYVEALLERGVKVTFCDLLESEGKAAEQEMKMKYGADKAKFITLDCSNHDDLRDVFEKTKSEYGSLDFVVNNVGYLDEFNWRKALQLNLAVAIFVTELTVELCSKEQQPGGAAILVHTASNGGLYLAKACPVYSTLKAGLIHFVRSCSVDTQYSKHGVKMMCICPSMVKTAFIEAFRDRTRFNDLVVARRNELVLLEPETVGKCLITMLENPNIDPGTIVKLTSENPEFLCTNLQIVPK